MTRSYMLQLAETIKRFSPPIIVDFNDPSLGVIYQSRFLGKPITLYVNSRAEPIAIFHNKIMYVFHTTSNSKLRVMREYYEGLGCHTKVLLYPNSRYLAFKDSEGEVHYTQETTPSYGDYSTVLPLPQA